MPRIAPMMIVCTVLCLSVACAGSPAESDEPAATETSSESALEQSDEQAEEQADQASSAEPTDNQGATADSEGDHADAGDSDGEDNPFADALNGGGVGAPGPETTRPQTRVSASLDKIVISDEEKLDETSTRTMLERRLDFVELCMQRAVDTDVIEGSLDGTLVLKFSVSALGRIGHIAVKESDVPDEVARCTSMKLGQVRLRRPSAPVEVTATYRLRAMRPEAVQPEE